MHDTCTIHGIRILITTPPKLDNPPHVTPTTSPPKSNLIVRTAVRGSSRCGSADINTASLQTMHDSRAGAQYGAQPKNWMHAFDDDDEQSRDSGGALEDPPSDWDEDEEQQVGTKWGSTRKT